MIDEPRDLCLDGHGPGGLGQILRLYGQPANALAGCGEYRVADGRGYSGNASFTHTAGAFGARHDVYIDDRRFVHSYYIILMEVRLLNASGVDCDFAFERRAESEHDGAANLLLDDSGIHHLAAIGGADDAVNFQFAL